MIRADINRCCFSILLPRQNLDDPRPKGTANRKAFFQADEVLRRPRSECGHVVPGAYLARFSTTSPHLVYVSTSYAERQNHGLKPKFTLDQKLVFTWLLVVNVYVTNGRLEEPAVTVCDEAKSKITLVPIVTGPLLLLPTTY